MNAEYFEYQEIQLGLLRKITAEEVKKSKGKTNWQKVDEITDEESNDAAKNDPDSALPTDEELKQFKPVKKNKEDK